MKGKLVAVALCALFALALVTVHLKSRETLLCYEIAQLELTEELLLDRLEFLNAEVEKQTGVVGLLNKAVEFGIFLRMSGFDGTKVQLFTPLEEDAALE